ncbi:hypothetical protein GCM10027299_46340 [Larkinella ripae]
MAQSDSSKPKSRLELGQKPAATSRVIQTRNFPFLKNQTITSLDRGATAQKNATLNQFYRNQLQTTSSVKTPARTASSEPRNLVAVENSSNTAETQKVDESMYTNELITVSNIYPNPADKSAEIDYQIFGPVKDAKLIFQSVLGAQVGEYVLDRNERKIRIVTSGMPHGMYFYKLSLDGKTMATKKLMVSHQ